MYEPGVVTALADRLGKATDADTRLALVRTIARLANREAPWKGDWWTTKPAHLGPYFDPAAWEESPRIQSALATTLAAASGDEFKSLAGELALNQALPRGAGPLLAAVIASGDSLRTPLLKAMVGRAQLDAGTVAIATTLDARSPALHGAVAQLLAGESTLGAGALPLARSAVLDAKLDPRIRGSLLAAIATAPGPQALDVAADVFSRLNPVPGVQAAGAPVVVTGPAPTPTAGTQTAATPTAGPPTGRTRRPLRRHPVARQPREPIPWRPPGVASSVTADAWERSITSSRWRRRPSPRSAPSPTPCCSRASARLARRRPFARR